MLSGDPWIYAAGACLFVSILLWPFLLAKYRGAPAAGPAPAEAFQPIARPEPKPAPQPVAEAAKAPARMVASAVPAEPPPAVPTEPKSVGTTGAANVSPAVSTTPPGATTSGGISPAVVYLQALKNQVEALTKDMDGLKVQISDAAQKSDSQFNAIIEHLQAIENRPVSALSQPAAAPPAVSMPWPEPAPAPQPAPEPARQDATAPVLSLDSALSSVMGPATELAPAPAAAPEPEPRRRGPVWPV